MLAHEHRLNQHPVRQFKEVLDCPVLGFLHNPLLQRIEDKGLIKPFDKGLGKVGHFLKGLDPTAIEPFPNLSGTEFLFSLFKDPIFKGLAG